MNKVATLGLAFLLVFSGCLGFGEDDIPEEDDTVEPVGETDLEGLEHEVNLLTARLDAEEAKLASLEMKVNGMTDAPDVLESLGCSEDEIARYTGDEWICSDDTDTTLDGDEVWNIVSGDFDDVNNELDYAWNDINSLWSDLEYIQNNMWNTTDEMNEMQYDIYDSINELNNTIWYIGYEIDDLNSNVDEIWDVIYDMELRISELESGLENATSCQLVPFGNCAGANLMGMDLSWMVLEGIDLTNANLRDANLTGARLEGVNLTGADLRGANVDRARFGGATGVNLGGTIGTPGQMP